MKKEDLKIGLCYFFVDSKDNDNGTEFFINYGKLSDIINRFGERDPKKEDRDKIYIFKCDIGSMTEVGTTIYPHLIFNDFNQVCMYMKNAEIPILLSLSCAKAVKDLI